MPVPSHILTCTDNRVIARDVYEFRFARPGTLTFRAGQFVLFDVALQDNPEDVQTRAFSIASAPTEDDLVFVAKMKEGGRASRWIAESLKTGSQVRTQGPFGNFVLRNDNPKDLLFIATSTGVAPFRSQIIDVLSSDPQKKIDLIFGVRAEEDMFWKEEFESLAQTYENFFVHFPLTKPTDGWTGHRGRVQTMVELMVKDLSNKNIYVCGSPDMTKEVKQLCLEKWGIAKGDVHVEGYI